MGNGWPVLHLAILAFAIIGHNALGSVAAGPASQSATGPAPGGGPSQAGGPEESLVITVELAPEMTRPVRHPGETFFTTELKFSYNGGRVILSGDPPPSTPFGVDDRLVMAVERPDGTTRTWDWIFNTRCFENQPVPPQDLTDLFQRGENVVSVALSDICSARVGTFGRLLLSEVGVAPRGGVGFPALLVWLLPLGLAVTVGGTVLVRRHRASDELSLAPIGNALPEEPSLTPGSQAALLALLRREDREAAGDENQPFEVSGTPVTVGTNSGCAIRLPPAPSVAPEHARIWFRDGRVMVHHIAPGYLTRVGDKQVIWASLGAGDEVAIGPHVLRCVGFIGIDSAEPDSDANAPDHSRRIY